MTITITKIIPNPWNLRLSNCFIATGLCIKMRFKNISLLIDYWHCKSVITFLNFDELITYCTTYIVVRVRKVYQMAFIPLTWMTNCLLFYQLNILRVPWLNSSFVFFEMTNLDIFLLIWMKLYNNNDSFFQTMKFSIE